MNSFRGNLISTTYSQLAQSRGTQQFGSRPILSSDANSVDYDQLDSEDENLETLLELDDHINLINESTEKKERFPPFFEIEALKDPDEPQRILNRAAEDALNILREFTYSDPLVKLNDFYERKGFKSIGDCFRMTKHKEKRGTPPYWSCVFRCPLTGEETASKLPLALVFGDQPTDDLAEISINLFGTYKIINDLVVFKSVKGAKKSVAVAAMFATMENYGTFLDPSRVLVESIDEASTCLLLSSKQFQRPKKSATTRRFPRWVHELHEVGVRRLVISYKEHRRNNLPWVAKPAQICCTLSIEEPKKLIFESGPCPSKNIARQNVVTLCVEKLHRVHSDTIPKTEPNRDIASTLIEKQRLMDCDVQVTSFIFPTPSWACSPIKLNKGRHGVFLYEIGIFNKSGKSVVCNDLSLCQGEVTRIGILLAEEIAPISRNPQELQQSPELSTSFRNKYRSCKPYTVTLRRRKVIDLRSSREAKSSVGSDMALIHHFNRIAVGWKSNARQIESQLLRSTMETDHIPLARTCLFVPIKSKVDGPEVEIDWSMLQDVYTNKCTPYLVPRQLQLTMPYVGRVTINDACCVFIMLSLFACLPEICENLSGQVAITYTFFENDKLLWGTVICLFLFIVMLFTSVLPARRTVSKSALRNCFIQHKPHRKSIFVTKTHQNKRLSSRSAFACQKKWTKTSSNVFEKETFAHYYMKQHGISIRHKGEKLVASYKIKNYRNQIPFGDKNSVMYLPPELIYILPMPRDAAFVVGMAERFVPAIEREVTLSFVSQTLREMGKERQCHLHNASNQKFEIMGKHRQRSLASLLAEATTIYPCITYQRLEFLGDSVLGFFLAVSIFCRNSTLQWDYDDISQISSNAGRNVSLVNGALRIGLNQLVYAGEIPWKGPFTPATPHRRKQRTRIKSSNLSKEAEGKVLKIADFRLSDAVESLLGATYLFEMGNIEDPTGASITVALLELLCLPMPNGEDEEASSWFRARGPCLKGGYPFELDQTWRDQLVKIGTTIYCEDGLINKLQEGHERVLEKLALSTDRKSLTKHLDKELSKILIFSALFDDNLEGPQEDQMERDDKEKVTQTPSVDARTTWCSMEELFKVALLRDNLHHLGVHALQLRLTEEAFRLYPDATVGDLQVIRTCALTDDVVIYIMVKAGMHECMFDKLAKGTPQFITLMVAADKIGRAKWQKRNGWILLGGVHEFHRRCEKYFPGNFDRAASSGPLYPGLNGGRLCGQSKKISEAVTGDLQFSFKSIIGALVLSLGVEGMWCLIGPLFQELLVLSADELRAEYKTVSSICRDSKPGKKGGRSKFLRYGVMD